jgi:hypothetical protein
VLSLVGIQHRTQPAAVGVAVVYGMKMHAIAELPSQNGISHQELCFLYHFRRFSKINRVRYPHQISTDPLRCHLSPCKPRPRVLQRWLCEISLRF